MPLFGFDFLKKVPFKDKIIFDPTMMGQVVMHNRQTLSGIQNWIDEAAFKNSCFDYGVPQIIRNNINKQIDNSITYSDVLFYLMKKHFVNPDYLEIGVSVGKNFFQIMNNENVGSLTAFDIEEINPVLAAQLIPEREEKWETPSVSIKKSSSSLKDFKYINKDIRYLCADVWDENSWAKLKGNKYNVVFSDALHSAKAILFEFEMLSKYELLDEKFIIVWDDLIGKMRNAFFKIIRNYDKKYQIKDIYLVPLNGWVGQYENPHSVGIISNFVL
ncbi:MAG: hypothetical protein JSS98_05245 [Bacteroidetes bacterium]|nr:hypothetical protein [Bacteroidota bacterium]